MKHGNTLQLMAMGAVCVLMAGCGNSGGDTPSASGGSTTAANPYGIPVPSVDPNRAVEVAFVTNNASDYWTIARKGTEKATGELKGVTVDFKIPANGTAEEQKDIVDGLVASGVKAIAISPKDPANQTQYLKDISTKALLVTQDSDAPESGRACYIGTDNKAAGKLAGEALKKALPNGGDVEVFVGSKDAQNAKDRFDGLKEAVQGTKINIVDEITDDADHAKAKANAADVLTSKPNVVGLVGLWSYNGPAILSAVKDANKVGKVHIVCFDEEDDTLAGVKSGAIDATIVQQPFEFGYKAVKTMAAFLRGDTSLIPKDKLDIVDAKTIDKSNVDDFTTNLNKLRGRTK